jgi:hypothetical protein
MAVVDRCSLRTTNLGDTGNALRWRRVFYPAARHLECYWDMFATIITVGGGGHRRSGIPLRR